MSLEKVCKVCLLISILGLIIGYFNNFEFWFLTLNPQVTRIETSSIDTTQDPIQTDPVDKTSVQLKINDKNFTLLPQADYNISGMVVAKNVRIKGSTYYDDFDRLAPIDLGIAWGKLADPNFERYFTCESYKDISHARALSCDPKPNLPFEISYFENHTSHNHLIPANGNILKALMLIKKKDIVNLQGYLVDALVDNVIEVETSLSRTDTNLSARGGGACEVMYVKKVKIGNKVYQ